MLSVWVTEMAFTTVFILGGGCPYFVAFCNVTIGDHCSFKLYIKFYSCFLSEQQVCQLYVVVFWYGCWAWALHCETDVELKVSSVFTFHWPTLVASVSPSFAAAGN